MNDSSILTGALVLGPPLGLLLGALLLQAATAFCGLEDVRYLRALGVTVLWVAGFIVAGWAVYAAVSITGCTGSLAPAEQAGLIALAAVPLGFLAGGLVFRFFLRTSYGRALLVELAQGFIVLVITGLIGGAVLVVLAARQLLLGRPTG